MSKVHHFIGIKGSGMSALSFDVTSNGHKVQGVMKSITLPKRAGTSWQSSI